MDLPNSYEDFVKQYQRTSRGLSYERYMKALNSALVKGDKDPGVKKANEAFSRLKDVGPSVVHQNSTLTNISVQYANDEYIGENLMPVVNVANKTGIYYAYDKRSRMGYPDDALGPRGQANEISDARTTATYQALVYGYENYLDAETLENQDAPLNEMVDLTESLAEAMAFRRELRIAAILTNSANYGSNVSSLAASVRWDTSAGGNPISDIQGAIANLWTGRGAGKTVAFTSFDAYLQLSRHPAILDMFKYSGTAVGLATPSMLGKFFGIDELYIGKARKDTANEGQTAAYSRIWGNVFGVIRVATRPGIRNAAFGYTLRHGEQKTVEWFDPRVGKSGGYWAKSSVSEDHKVVAADTGFLISNVIG